MWTCSEEVSPREEAIGEGGGEGIDYKIAQWCHHAKNEKKIAKMFFWSNEGRFSFIYSFIFCIYSFWSPM